MNSPYTIVVEAHTGYAARMHHVEAPDPFDGSGPSLFLAGGVTGCPDWQAELEARLAGLDVTALNPRRRRFDVTDASATVAQIEWEYVHLRRATAIAFWFPAESICPIALFELGVWSTQSKPLLVGADPAYPRRVDIIEQLRLARPQIVVAPTLEALATQIDSLFATRSSL